MGKLIVCLFLLFLPFELGCSSALSFFRPQSPKTCLSKESLALLQFKHSFSIDGSSSSGCGKSSYPKTNTWKNGTDCCLWDGVTCDGLTGHVIALDLSCSWLNGYFPPNSSLLRLPHLQRLSLAENNFYQSAIPHEISLLGKLTHLNLSASKFSGQIPPEIFRLFRLISLDLSYNELLAFDNTHNKLETISQNLTTLRALHLDWVFMPSFAPKYLSNLSSSLTSLRLSCCSLKGKLPDDFFLRFPSLKVLDLSSTESEEDFLPRANSFSGELPNSIGYLKSLQFLDLSANNLKGQIPDVFQNLSRLDTFALSNNRFSGPLPLSVFNLTGLSSLDLSSNRIVGPLSHNICGLSNLYDLDLSDNFLSGRLPPWLFNLKWLSSLAISGNQMVGPFPLNISGLSNLFDLNLSYNLLNGRIPSWLFTIPSLKYLNLDSNKFTGPIDPNFQQPNSVESVVLSNNEIHGPIPSSMFELGNLCEVYLALNKLSGTIECNKFQKLKYLRIVDFSHNSELSLTDSRDANFTLLNLEAMLFSSCNIAEFPNSLRTLENLVELDLSNNKIRGQISRHDGSEGWPSLKFLHVSGNCLSGLEHPWSNVQFLDFRSNSIRGQLQMPPPSTQVFMISKNKLEGEIPSSICTLSSLQILDLSNNGLSGVIPHCLSSRSHFLSVLDLGNNKFHSSIPAGIFAEHNSLTYLNFNGNRLQGSLPRSLINCRYLEVIDIGNNMINDTFPHWLAALPELKVVMLRSNRFHGTIGHPKVAFPFQKLQILDLSHNDFSGSLPRKYLRNLKSFGDVDNLKSFGDVDDVEPKYLGEEEGYLGEEEGYFFSVEVIVTMKGLEFKTKVLTILTIIDFSNNRFQGEIPQEVGWFKLMEVLNFSHNSLTGHIPSTLGNLTAVESLDLSSNQLVGEIPQQLAALTFLEVLNLSYNKLIGPIPQGSQLVTFSNDSYIGNSGLCGFPLSKKCHSDPPPPPHSPSERFLGEDPTSWLDWKFAMMMGYGCGLALGLLLGYIVFTTGKPWWFVKMVETKQNRLARRLNPRQRAQGN